MYKPHRFAQMFKIKKLNLVLAPERLFQIQIRPIQKFRIRTLDPQHCFSVCELLFFQNAGSGSRLQHIRHDLHDDLQRGVDPERGHDHDPGAESGDPHPHPLLWTGLPACALPPPQTWRTVWVIFWIIFFFLCMIILRKERTCCYSFITYDHL